MSDRNARKKFYKICNENSYVQYIQSRQSAPSIESILILGALLGDVVAGACAVVSLI